MLSRKLQYFQINWNIGVLGTELRGTGNTELNTIYITRYNLNRTFKKIIWITYARKTKSRTLDKLFFQIFRNKYVQDTGYNFWANELCMMNYFTFFVTWTWWMIDFFPWTLKKLDDGGFDGTYLYGSFKIVNKQIQSNIFTLPV